MNHTNEPKSASLRRKLVGIMLAVSLGSLVVLGTAFMVHERRLFEHETAVRLRLLADVIASNSTSALASHDPAAAREILGALATDPEVKAAAVYDAGGRLFAQYRRADVAAVLPKEVPDEHGLTFTPETFALARPIELNGQEPIGTLYLVADTVAWRETLWRFAGLMTLLFVGVLAVALLIFTWLQRLVTKPIADLVDLMRRVGEEQNYGLRAKGRSNDELGFLAAGFNRMLDEIAKGRVEFERARDDLHKLNQDLEQRVAERTAQLEAANKELEAFSYSVSHDLRAPLRAIDGFSSALMEDYAQALDDVGKNYLQRVRKGCQRMGQLIDDLLGLARVIRHEMRSEPLDLAALARAIAGQLAQAQSRRQVDMTIPESLPVQGDAGLLPIALENLLSNAWKFTQKTPNARIELGAVRENGETVYFVRDNGAGFDMTYVEKLFRPFQRPHDAETYPGSGIGLATAQRVIHRHGGGVWAEGAVGQGATFYFTLKEVA